MVMDGGCRWCGLYLKATPANPRTAALFKVGSARHLPIDKMDAQLAQPNVGGARSHTHNPSTPPHAVFLGFGHRYLPKPGNVGALCLVIVLHRLTYYRIRTAAWVSLSPRRAGTLKSSRPKGPPARGWDPEGP